MSDLSGRVVLITGGCGLLGAAMIDDIQAKGGIAINLDVHCESNLDRFTYQCDITKDDDIRAVVKEIYERFDRLDGLVNNAYPRTKDWGMDFMQEPMSSWRENLDMQLNSHVSITKEVCRYMREHKQGNIVNIASIYGVIASDMSLYSGTQINPVAGYSAIKGGLISFSRYLASYHGPFGIRVNCVSPGGIFDHQDPQFVKRYEARVPLGRMGRPEDIAPVVSFLLSEDAQYITGQNIIVDGGVTIV